MSIDFDFVDTVSFHMGKGEGPPVGLRKSFRTIPAGLRVRLDGEETTYKVNDISAGGISMNVPADRCVKDQDLALDLLVVDKLYLHGLSARVVRRFAEECACAFQELSRAQELKLDKLVLEMQKRFILQRKQEREEEEKHCLEEGVEGASCELPTIRLQL